MGVRELAATAGLHANTVREHLDQLVEVGMVTSGIAAPAGRGRPMLHYTATPETAEEDPQSYRMLARVLAEELAQRPDAAAAALDAGRRWGESMVVDSPRAPDGPDSVRRLVRLLDDAGFAPDAPGRPDGPILLRHCPFSVLAHERPDVVCRVHLGLMRGALDALGAPFDALRLEPFVTTDLCIAHLGARSNG